MKCNELNILNSATPSYTVCKEAFVIHILLKGGDQMHEKVLSEEIEILVLQLVKQHHMMIATQLLTSYMIRHWKVSHEHAKYYMKQYFMKVYPIEVQQFQDRLKKLTVRYALTK